VSIVRKIGLGVLLAAAALGGTYGTMRAGLWNTDYDTIKAKYANTHTRFVTIDGVPMRVSDQGQGPVVVMLHGSILNLNEWDMVADRLKGRYRIIQLDWSPYGLTGPDTKGEYSTARAAQLLAGLVDQMKLDTFALVSTSNGANVALEYNAHHPEHIKAMAFSILPLERPSQTRKVDWRIKNLLWFHTNYLPDYHSHEFYRLILKDTTPKSFEPTDAMVDMMYDMNNLPGAVDRQKAYIQSNVVLFKTSDVGAIAGKVTAPVLLQWCGYDTVISQGPEASLKRFTNTKVDLVRYPDTGHFPMWEQPDRFAADLGKFLDRVFAPVTPV
jgi:pimeloyl-ACP methyl ester carboxylesterase